MAAVQRVENDDVGNNYDPSSFKNSCPGTRTSDHIESDSVKAFHDALNDGDFHEERTEGEWVRLISCSQLKACSHMHFPRASRFLHRGSRALATRLK